MTAILEIAQNCRDRIEAVTPRTKWRSDEAFHYESSIHWDEGLPLSDQWHRAFRVAIGPSYEQGSALQACGEVHRAITQIDVTVLYAGFDLQDPAEAMKLQAMQAEDRYDLAWALENVRSFPTLTTGGMYRRQLISTECEDLGSAMVSRLHFEIEYYEGT